MAIKALSKEQILALPAAVDIPTAGRCFGIGRTRAYEMARSGKFPCPVLPLDREFRVTRAAILAALGIADEPVADVSASAA